MPALAASTEFLTDLRPEVVAYEANFDETRQMPRVLPVTFPNLLVNGSMGVGWAMACSVPPHNTAEVINAALLVLDDPDVPIDRLLKVMPGPDLPGGGIIVNPENLASIYETGRGTVMVQGRIEQLPGQQVLRITELPYQVSAKSIVEQAVDGAKAGKITEIYTAELPKNLTDANGIDVQVKCKRGGSVQRLMHELVEHTKLRDTLAFNFTVLVDNVPQTLSLRQILVCFLDFRKEVVAKRLEHELEVLRRRLHLLLAERAAADVIDQVVAIIRTAKDDDDSKAKLMAQLRYVPHGGVEVRTHRRGPGRAHPGHGPQAHKHPQPFPDQRRNPAKGRPGRRDHRHPRLRRRRDEYRARGTEGRPQALCPAPPYGDLGRDHQRHTARSSAPTASPRPSCWPRPPPRTSGPT